jgi:WD40 repeat protein/energy-coupling factor transporter ATP-binding protein EcfA2
MLSQASSFHQGKPHLDGNDTEGTSVLFNPFPGLRPFTIEESHLYFGRDGQVDEVLSKLAQHRFVSVLGYSGSGKSSLMQCGVLPVIYGGFIAGISTDWEVIVLRPGSKPIDSLAKALIMASPQMEDLSKEEFLIQQRLIGAVLCNSHEGLVEAIKLCFPGHKCNFLLSIDQFEELFRYRDKEHEAGHFDESGHFVTILLNAIQEAHNGIYLTLSMRSDYLGDCSRFNGLTQLINKSNYLVPLMTREEKRTAIEGPVAVAGGHISKRLVKQILSDIGDTQDQLPIIQHAMMRTWDYWQQNHEPGEPLDIRHYNSVGRVSEALSQHANEAYNELDLRQKEIAETLFKVLTEKNQDNQGVRRPVRLGMVAELSGTNEEDVVNVIDVFRAPGRSFLMPAYPNPINSETLVEISHESLMRIWTRLKVWVDEEFDSAQMYRRLSEAAAMYQVGKTGLWKPPDLQLALNWQKKQRPTRTWASRYDDAFERAVVFLDTSRVTWEADQKNAELLQKRLLRRTRIVALVLGIASVISILFFLFGLTQQYQAEKNFQLAENRRISAEENERTAKQTANELEEQKKILENQQKELIEKSTLLEREVMRSREANERAMAALKDARDQREFADIQSEIASTQTEYALISERMAIKALESQERIYKSKVAQATAVKSQQIDEKDLSALLAKIAYDLNKGFGENPSDPYIYDGLYFAMRQIQGKSYSTAQGLKDGVRSLVFPANGDTFYATGDEGRILSASLKDFSQRQQVFKLNQFPNRGIDVSADGKWMVVASDSAYLQVMDAKNFTKGPVRTITGHSAGVVGLKFLPKGPEFITVSNDKTIRWNNAETGQSRLLHATQHNIRVMDISPDGKSVVIGTLEGKAIIIDIASQMESVVASQASNPVHAVGFDAKGEIVAIGTEKGSVMFWSIPKKATIREFKGHKARVSKISFSRDGKYMATASFDKTIQLWMLDRLNDLPIILRDSDAILWDLVFSPNSEYLLAGAGNGEVRVWPTHPDVIAAQICDKINRKIELEEWNRYVADDLPLATETCATASKSD